MLSNRQQRYTLARDAIREYVRQGDKNILYRALKRFNRGVYRNVKAVIPQNICSAQGFGRGSGRQDRSQFNIANAVLPQLRQKRCGLHGRIVGR